MSKKTLQNKRNRGERERLRKKKEESQMKLEEIQDLEIEKAELPLEEETPETEEVEKEYDESWSMQPRPTSFEELDAARVAEEKAHEVRKVTYDTQDLVWNILHDYELEATEKADRIMDVADGFAERVNSMMMESDDMQKDIEQLQVEAILATYQRTLNPIQKAQDWAVDQILKRELSYKARKRLQEGDFALPSKRKYPIHDKAHVRNALARAAQMIARGGEAAADAKAALPKIRAAAKKYGIEVSKSAILIEKDAKGDWRWIGRPSNNFLDRQGDIMSKAAHEEYVEFLKNNPEFAPSFNVWHIPGYSRENKVDAWIEHDGALILSGKLTEPEAAALLKQQAQYDLGMSVAGSAIRNENTPQVIEHYWLYEVSDLPLQYAANPFTSLETMTKEAGMNLEEKVKYLATYMGSEEEAMRFLQKTEQTQKTLAEAGLTSKAVEEEPKQAEKPAPVEEPAPQPLDVDVLVKQIAEKVGEQFDMDGLSAFVAKAQDAIDKVPLLEAALQKVQKGREDELVELLTPPLTKKFAWSQEARASASDETLLKENDKTDEKIKKANPQVPEDAWLSQATGTVPVQEV